MYVVDACIHTLAYVDVCLYLQDMAFYFKAFSHGIFRQPLSKFSMLTYVSHLMCFIILFL